MRYRKKPVEVEAVQLRWSTQHEVHELVGEVMNSTNPAYEIPPDEASDTCGEDGPTYLAFKVTTMHGETAIVRHGDWIIRDGIPGTFYPCKPDIFEATYEPVEEVVR